VVSFACSTDSIHKPSSDHRRPVNKHYTLSSAMQVLSLGGQCHCGHGGHVYM
jgi:hypothetical protein